MTDPHLSWALGSKLLLLERHTVDYRSAARGVEANARVITQVIYCRLPGTITIPNVAFRTCLVISWSKLIAELV